MPGAAGPSQAHTAALVRAHQTAGSGEMIVFMAMITQADTNLFHAAEGMPAVHNRNRNSLTRRKAVVRDSPA